MNRFTLQGFNEIKLSEGEDSISKKYWLDPANVESSKLVYCDKILGGRSVSRTELLYTVFGLPLPLRFCEMLSPCPSVLSGLISN